MTDHDATYEMDVSRETSTDFLEDASGAILQARVEKLAEGAKAEGADVSISYRFGPGTISLVISAEDPEPLQDLARAAMLSFGYELPEPEGRLGPTPEDDDTGALGLIEGREGAPPPVIELSMDAALALRTGNAVAALMRGSLMSAASRNDIKVLASELRAKALRAAHPSRGQGSPTQEDARP